jgi:hypothetical protein
MKAGKCDEKRFQVRQDSGDEEPEKPCMEIAPNPGDKERH